MTIGGRWAVALLVVLFLSLGANFFLGGLFAGGALRGGDQLRPVRALTAFLLSLPEEARPVLRERFRARRPELRAKIAAVAEARGEVAKLLAREDLDRARLDAAFVELRMRTAEAQTLLHEIVAEAMMELPPEVRAEWQPRWTPGHLFR
ncbi:MAG: periplasmic heavy metal sensor [Kiloniellales bacterium]|nr:periplasmic heavy metal sensor [Kiloniellales bacterium]